MKTRILLTSLVFGFIFLFSSCKDDESMAPIYGEWVGTQSHIQGFADGIPIAIYDETDDQFNVAINFGEDGTVTVIDNDIETSGTWEYTDSNKKIIATVDFQNDFLEPTETLSIKKISETSLTLYIEKHGTQDVPDYGEMTGTVKVTLNFVKK